MNNNNNSYYSLVKYYKLIIIVIVIIVYNKFDFLSKYTIMYFTICTGNNNKLYNIF